LTDKILVNGEVVWANPYYSPQPGTAGHDWTWRGTAYRPSRTAEATPALLIVMEKMGKAPYYTRDVDVSPDGSVRAEVLIDGEWGTYTCTRAEIEARKGGTRVDESNPNSNSTRAPEKEVDEAMEVAG